MNLEMLSKHMCPAGAPIRSRNVHIPASKLLVHAGRLPSLPALVDRSGELGDDKGYMASLKAMLRVLVDPENSKTCVIFEKSPNSPDPAHAYYFFDNNPDVVQAKTSSQQSEPFPKEILSCEQPWANHCTGATEMLPDTPNKLSMANTQTMKQDVCFWSDALTPFEIEDSGFPSHEYTCLSMIQDHHHPTFHGGNLSVLKYVEQHDESTSDTTVSADAFSDVESKPDIFPSVYAHPIRKPNSYSTATSFQSFSDPEIASSTTSPASSQEYLPGVGRHGIHKTHWLDGQVGSAVLLSQSSPGSVEDPYTPVVSTCGGTAPLHWSSSGIPTSWEMQSQETDLQGAHWGNVRCFPGVHAHGRPVGGDPQLSTHTIDNVHGCLPLLNDAQPYLQHPPSFLHVSRPPVYSAGSASGKDRDAVEQGASPLHFANSELMYHQHGYEVTPSVQSDLAGNPTLPCPGRRGSRAIPCHSENRNAFLIECKRRGLSYKDIKRLGGFKEAESTLRGRFRTLTKTKEQRVRKPQWKEKDIRLLCEAVNACSNSGKQVSNSYSWSCRPRGLGLPPKVSWKKVAQYIWTHGGSYHFGNATCKKKWCEVHSVKI
ncbi:uncharacterized protein ACLA_058390 [Aspergillus clavatus NRRL 1]|uniref:Myb-like domain-containing protein n=1 Tax=Aspergillus clavatus (strain ATCC 1007 / CBS 513.65 / DSM 816 / NCTC 3887 / NRRL 1 / QM 1276 / 107) TaxID=344612 RepID=A1C441_ASPCL|nr:uncharacterized protein ACLA_058390 [Aspergillus clavatus NRRL 1]EAW15181.1 conserved hypothetical protein [Aspergillus clavatus NRRL 1]